MTQRRVSAVILAGGRSSRFGRDKLVEPVDGRPLLEHAIDAVRPFATQILVVGAPAEAGAGWSAWPGSDPSLPPDASLVHDAVAYEGPLVGLVAGLRAAREPLVVVAGGDMPTLVASVIEALLAELDDPEVDAAVLEHEGRARPLPMAIRRAAGLAAAERLVGGGERRLRALGEALATRVIAEPTWRLLDPDGRTVRDVDTPADLR
ncbi:MAG: molybdenum cofactor guanylyltransferase [Candidatus Limnocylindrales bacterium]